MSNNKMIVAVVTTISVFFLFCNFAFAGSTIKLDGSVKYIDNSTYPSTPTNIDNIILTESSTSSWANTGGRFTITIPADLNICNIGSNTSQDPNIVNTSLIGTMAAPKGLYVLGSGFSVSGSPTIYVSSGSNNYSILNVSIQSDGSLGFGIPSGSDNYASLAIFNTFSPINIAAGEVGTDKVGEIYYNSTTKEIVITLAAKGVASTSYLEKFYISGLKLIPRNTTGTGNQAITFADGDNGANLLGISSHTITVMKLTAPIPWYMDSDGDGYGDPNNSINSAAQPSGYVSDNSDCDDSSSSIYPGATEIQNDGIDQNCDGGDSVSLSTWYYDFDGDGYGDSSNSTTSVSKPTGYVSDKTDCNDNSATVHPGATEIAGDGIDQDCNGSDLTTAKTWYYDSDGDGYGDYSNSLASATKPMGYVSTYTDCNDNDASVHPLAAEIPGDGIDQDCNGIDAASSGIWYYDSDGDGYGDSTKSLTSSTQPIGYVYTGTDCNDNDATINPGATEIAGDGIDQDCDGSDLAVTGAEQISLLAPTNNETISFGASGGKIAFSFSKIANAAKYILHLDLNDILNDTSFAIPVELIPPGTTSSTPGFSETFIGMVYELALDTATWDVLALYDIKWGVEAYDSAGSLIGSTFEGSVATKYINSLKFIASNSIAMTNPTLGEELSLTSSAPSFQWDAYQGASNYTLILAHVGSLGFDSVITQDNLTLNLFPMSDSTWQSMPTGTWYWTIFGYNATGSQTPSGFTIFDFEVQ